MVSTGKAVYLVNAHSREKVELGDLISHGAAGTVFRVPGDSSRVIKIYNPEVLKKDGAKYEAKLKAMLQRPVQLRAPPKPVDSPVQGEIIQLAWPLATVQGRAKNSFLGFAMPALEMQHTDVLEYVLQEKMAKRRGLRSDLGARLMLAHNLCAVVSSIHAQGHAIVDLKPLNIQFYKHELYVAVLDCDGFHIDVPGGAAMQVTPGYCAPEYIDKSITLPEQQDRFALAVVVFRLLNFGAHPYDGIPSDPSVPSETNDRVRAQLFAYATRPNTRLRPRPGSTHECVPMDLRQLFDRAFGAIPSVRPSAREWQQQLFRYADHTQQRIDRCSEGHLYFVGSYCGSCTRLGALGAVRSSGRPSATKPPMPSAHPAKSAPPPLPRQPPPVTPPVTLTSSPPTTPPVPSAHPVTPAPPPIPQKTPPVTPSPATQATNAPKKWRIWDYFVTALFILIVVPILGLLLKIIDHPAGLLAAIPLTWVYRAATGRRTGFMIVLVASLALLAGSRLAWDKFAATRDPIASKAPVAVSPPPVVIPSPRKSPQKPTPDKPLPKQLRAYYGLMLSPIENGDGLTVSAVDPKGPAARSGLQVGDRVLKVFGRDIVTADDFLAAFNSQTASAQLPIELVRLFDRYSARITPIKVSEADWQERQQQLNTFRAQMFDSDRQ